MSGTTTSGSTVMSGGILVNITPVTGGGELEANGSAALVDASGHTVAVGGQDYRVGDVLDALVDGAFVSGSSGTDISGQPVLFNGATTTVSKALAAAAESGGSDVTPTVLAAGNSFQPRSIISTALNSSNYQTALLRQSPPASGDVSAATATHIVTIDPSTLKQNFYGPGGALTGGAAYAIMNYMTRDQRHQFFTMLKNDGFRSIRIAIGGNDFDYRPYWTPWDSGVFDVSSDFQDVIPCLLEWLAVDPSLRCMATPWSPPASLKDSGVLKGGSFISSAANYQTYAAMLCQWCVFYASLGIPVYYVGIGNEPQQKTAEYPKCGMSTADTAGIGAALEALLAKATFANGITPKVTSSDTSWGSARTWLPGDLATGAFGAMAFHWYNGNPGNISSYTTQYPNVDVLCSEAMLMSGSPGLQTQITQLIGDYCTWMMSLGAKAIMMWNIILDQTNSPANGNTGVNDGGNWSGWYGASLHVNNTTGVVTPSADYYVMAHLGRMSGPNRKICGFTAFGQGKGATDLVVQATYDTVTGERGVFLWNPTSLDMRVIIKDAVTGNGYPVIVQANSIRTELYSGADIVSASSNFLAAALSDLPAALAAPGLTLTAGDSQLAVGITPASGTTPQAYAVYWGYSATALQRAAIVTANGTNVVNFTLNTASCGRSDTNGIVNGTPVYVTVSAINAQNVEGAQSASQSATPVAGGTTTNPTKYSVGLSSSSVVSGGTTTVTFTLDAAATSAVTITPSDKSAGGTWDNGTLTIAVGSTSTSTTYTAGSTAGTVTLTGTNTSSLTAGTATLTVSAQATAPGAPTLTLKAGDSQIAATVAAPASNGGSAITGYPIVVNDATTPVTTLTAPGTYTITGLTNGTSATVKAGATNSVGTTYSADQSATPVAAPAATSLLQTYMTSGVSAPSVASKIDLSSGLVEMMLHANLSTISPSGNVTLIGCTDAYKVTAMQTASKSLCALVLGTGTTGPLGLVVSDGSKTNYTWPASGFGCTDLGIAAGADFYLLSAINTSSAAVTDKFGNSVPAKSWTAYTSTDGVTWTQKATTAITTGLISAASISAPYCVGIGNGITNPNKYYQAAMYCGTTEVFNVDFTDQTVGAATVTDAESNVWTMNTGSTIVAAS
ncbi:hypothetical protein A0U92_03685 [Acetobacter aceti]|uniref:Fibronectin type-III domain-containing protein n=1 Tax=Acetobacter aceti TaxID=435 RepID=A0A1U9KDZ5_ACEAC|nr:hypothetical protein [Acetobacter aceti]AQS84020.1 hypothetical protein A0U92_03685 [Acetobacter aceti]